MPEIERRLPPEIIARIIEMFTVGCYSKSEINRETGISRPTIDSIICDKKPGNLYVLNKERDEFIINCYKDNLSISSTASAASTTNNRVIAVLKRHDVIPQRGRKLKNLIGNKTDGWIQMTHSDYAKLLSDCGNKCEICGQSFEHTQPHVDHKHGVLKIRGVLCRRCNIGLAFVEEEEYRQKAIEYLATHPV